MHDSSHQAGDVPLVLFLHVDGQHLHTLLLHLGHLKNVVLNKMIKNLGLLINVFKNKMIISLPPPQWRDQPKSPFERTCLCRT